MSLRYKALAAVLVIVAGLTAGLLALVRRDVAAGTRADIEEELALDGVRLNEQLSNAATISLAGLRSTLTGESLEKWVKGWNGELKQNMTSKSQEWATASRADASIAALRPLPAQESGAMAYHKGDDSWVTGAWPSAKAELLAAAPPVHELIHDCLAIARTTTRVVAVGTSLLLAVAQPFWEQANTYGEFSVLEDRLNALQAGSPEAAKTREALAGLGDPYGAAVVFIELTDAWALRNRLDRPRAIAVQNEADIARHDNPIQQVLFTQSGVAASTIPSHSAAAALSAARKSPGSEFQVDLDAGQGLQTYTGITRNFDDPAGNSFSFSRPGFLALKSLDTELTPLRNLLRRLTAVGAAMGVLGALAAYTLAWLVIRRLRTLQVATEKVRAGDFHVTVPVDSRDEVGTLAVAFNNMIKGLQALGLYTDSVLARSVLDNPELLGNKAARHEGTVMFTDIRNFTGITESMDASALTAQLNEYFSAIGEHVKKEGGYLDKFIGDAVMAFWGAPFLSTQDHAARACRAAMHCMRAASELRRQWEKEGKPLFFQRIGVATGEVVVGNIGSATKKNFTVIGDSVNLANRLEGASKVYGTEILLDERTVELAGNAILVREVDEIVVRGKQQRVRVFELVGLAAETSTRAKRIIDGYGAALRQYRAGNFEGAKATLIDLRKSDPEDGPSKWLLGRCEEVLSGKSVPTPLQITKSYGPLKP